MSYELQGRLNLKLLFNGWEFPFQRANSIGFLHMSSGSQIGVPMFHMVLQDNTEVLSQVNRLNDSSLVQIVIQEGEQPDSNSYSFRTNYVKRTPNDGGYSYEFDGYFDCVKYWQESTAEPITATSSGAIKQIAETCDLKFEGDTTTDSQTWWPRNRLYHEWVHSIKEHGFRTDTSCMRAALNFDRTLVYKDIANIKKIAAKFSFADPQPGFLLVTDAQPVQASGTSNHFSGYADQVIEQNLSEDTFNRITKEIQVKKRAGEGSLLMSSFVKKSLKQANVSFGPISPGNAHVEYMKAAYQNKRLNGLYSSGLDVITPQNTDLKVLDMVSINMEKADGYLKMYSGQYIVANRTIYISGSNYSERLNLRRNTLNAQLADSVG